MAGAAMSNSFIEERLNIIMELEKMKSIIVSMIAEQA